MNQLKIKLKNITLRSPIMTASGTSGSGDEISRIAGSKALINSLGAFVTKGVTFKSRPGNSGIRVIETQSGLLNSIGLQNKGVETFTQDELPQLAHYNLPIIVNISAESVEGFQELAAYLVENDTHNIIKALEINVSCPNIREGGVAFGTNPKLVERIVQAVKVSVGDQLIIITKLSPNVTDITEPGKAAIAGGSDVLSMINTLRGIAINIEEGKPFLGNIYGGLSGPAIKPVGLFMVYECFKKIQECTQKKVPIIGIGGISNWKDALEYIMAGATGIGIGTGWFVNNNIFTEIEAGLTKYMDNKNKTILELTGISHR